jgi:hypothetical protein
MKNKWSRRRFIKKSALFACAGISLPFIPSFVADMNASASISTSTPIPEPRVADILILNASARSPAAHSSGFHMGTASAPGGHTIIRIKFIH